MQCIFLVFSKLLFYAVRKCLDCSFPVISGFSTVYSNPHPDTLLFINLFLNVGEGTPTMTSGSLSATFPTLWLKPLATQLVCN